MNLTKSNSFKASGLANQKVFYLTYHQDFDYRHHYSFTHFHLLQKPSNDTHVHLSYRRTIKAIGAQGKSLLFRNKRGTVSKISFKRLNATKIENICGQYRIDLSNQAVKAIKRACDPATVEKVKKVRGPARK